MRWSDSSVCVFLVRRLILHIVLTYSSLGRQMSRRYVEPLWLWAIIEVPEQFSNVVLVLHLLIWCCSLIGFVLSILLSLNIGLLVKLGLPDLCKLCVQAVLGKI